MKNNILETFNIEDHIIGSNISYRGGTLRVDVSSIFPDVSNPIMGAYQNYLGGGMAGRIVGVSMFEPSELSADDLEVFNALLEKIKQHFYSLNAGGGDEYMVENVNNYEQNQTLPVSGY